MKRIVVLLMLAALFVTMMAINGGGVAQAVNTVAEDTTPPHGKDTDVVKHGSHGTVISQHGLNGKVYASSTCKITGKEHACQT